MTDPTPERGACIAPVYEPGSWLWKSEGHCQNWFAQDGCHEDRWPCTSPRRNQCRTGGVQYQALGVVWTEYAGQQIRCEELPW